jgi:hypothetical protein
MGLTPLLFLYQGFTTRPIVAQADHLGDRSPEVMVTENERATGRVAMARSAPRNVR